MKIIKDVIDTDQYFRIVEDDFSKTKGRPTIYFILDVNAEQLIEENGCIWSTSFYNVAVKKVQKEVEKRINEEIEKILLTNK